jgi:hypothetical protein
MTTAPTRLADDLGARSHNADRAHDPAARRILLRSEHMLDARGFCSWR